MWAWNGSLGDRWRDELKKLKERERAKRGDMNSGVVKQAREFGKSWQHDPLYRRMFTSVASTTTDSPTLLSI